MRLLFRKEMMKKDQNGGESGQLLGLEHGFKLANGNASLMQQALSHPPWLYCPPPPE